MKFTARVWITPFFLALSVGSLLAVSCTSLPGAKARVQPVTPMPLPDGNGALEVARVLNWTPSAEDVYLKACAACHGVDGRGVSPSQVGFDVPLPDFTSCTFASREPDADWVAVAHQGGPIRGFSAFMPSFGDALSMEELQSAMDHIRTFCADEDWPRGELNLPRPLVTEKAYPEDEAVIASTINMEDAGSVMNQFVYEKRFGARNQLELKVPFGYQETESGSWRGAALGDVSVGLKRALMHSHSSGSIFSVTGEIILPTGDEELGFGKGTPVFEPFVTFGKLLPANAFVHLQGGVEIPFDDAKAEREGFFRGVLGTTITEGPWGRAWSPMVEMLGATELESGAPIHWDVVPQVQITLNKRQHVMMNLGLRIPVDDATRTSTLIVYVLWDWFDGPFFEGW